MNPDTPPSEPSLPPPAPIPPHSNPKTLLLPFLVLLFASTSLFFAWRLFAPRLNPQPPTTTATPTVTSAPPATQTILFPFIRNNEIWLRFADGSSSQITRTGETIYAFDYYPGANLLVFAHGKKELNPNYYPIFQPEKVDLLDLSQSSSPKTIHTLAYQPTPNSDYVLQIRDVKISPDGNFVIISTSDSLYRYNISTRQTETLYSQPVKADQRFPIFSYLRPLCTASCDEIIITRGFYEGSDQVLLNSQNQKITDLDFESYASGKVVASFIDIDKSLAYEFTGSADSQFSQVTKLFFFNPVSQTSTPITTFPGTLYRLVLAGPATAYALVSNEIPRVTTATNKATYRRYFSIVQIDLATSKISDLLKFDEQEIRTEKGYISNRPGNLVLSPDSTKLYYSDYRGIYELDHNNPSSPQLIEPSAQITPLDR